MTLISQYDQAIKRGEIHDDHVQREMIMTMEPLVAMLNKPRHFFWKWRARHHVQGLYIHGPVGVGKTFLMDLLFQQVKTEQKIRFHFHHFMQQIDAKLRNLQGHRDPLLLIAKEFAKKYRLLCFDEFLVHDVLHAMILAELLQALLKQGIVMVFTSNTKPDDLYRNGVQRMRFMPVIALIKTHCQLLSMTTQSDYRLGRQPLLDTYLYPLEEEKQIKFEQQFEQLELDSIMDGVIRIQNREIPFIRCGKKAIWFDFKTICNLPRSQLDYLELADQFDTIFISNLPIFAENDSVFVILFIYLIDVLYDRGIRLVISAQASIGQLYQGGEMSQAFKRTASRLNEMQSSDYLSRHPRRKISSEMLY